MVKIRFTRIGTVKRPYYRMIACDSRRGPKGGKVLEILGTYDPKNISIPASSSQKQEKGLINLKTERVQYWLDKGAQLSPTVQSILRRLKISRKKAA